MRAEDARNETLDKINNAKFGWVHIKTCLVSGIGFYTDAYDLFVISLAVQMIGYVYYVDENNKVPANTETGIKMSALIGTLIG
jgi:PHS family inorganic phosphate transporter-like MFS transporter